MCAWVQVCAGGCRWVQVGADECRWVDVDGGDQMNHSPGPLESSRSLKFTMINLKTLET